MNREIEAADFLWVYDPEHWDSTFAWVDRDILVDGDRSAGALAEPKAYKTLLAGPDVWAVEIPTSVDDAGDPEDTEVRWFPNKEMAEAAFKAAIAAHAAGRGGE